MQKAGLIVAMRREGRPLLRHVGRRSRRMMAGRACWRFELSGIDCVLVHCGIGLERAKAAAASLIEAESPALIISFGVAGGAEESLQAGDVVAAENVILHEGGPSASPLPLSPLSPAEFSAAARAVSARGSALYRGTVITTRGSQVAPGQAADLVHPVLDMETYGIAQEAARRGIPLLSLRALSDSVREPLPFDLAALSDADHTFHPGRLLAQLIAHPGILPRLSKLRRNTRRAEENAAIAVMAVLAGPGSHPAPGQPGT